jgi:dTDP-4-amino-4,6-dideoxygalactose transaminase
LERWHQGRRHNASLYRQYFKSLGLTDDVVKLPVAVFEGIEEGGASNYHIYNQFVVRVHNRDKLRDYLQQQGIGCEVYYPVSLHQQECLQPYGYKNISLPVAERASLETLALPVYPDLQPGQLEYVVQKIAEFYQQ